MSSEDFIRKFFGRHFEQFEEVMSEGTLHIIKGVHQGRLAIHITGTIHGPSVITMTASYMLWNECWYALENIEQVIERIAQFYEMSNAQVGRLAMCMYELKSIVEKEQG